MSLTRANTEFLTVSQCGPLLTAAGMDGTTVDGTNLSLNAPIGRAVRALGHSVASPVLVTDTDVGQVAAGETDEFLDNVLLQSLGAILGNLDDVDITAGPRSEKMSQLAEQVERRMDRLQAAMDDAYGYGAATPEQGYITINIAEHD